jgi:CHAT domain-containing protein/tetratricopeptide (TPR) repeat protein
LAIASPAARALAAQPAAAPASENPSLVVQKARQLQRVGQLRAAEKLLRATLNGKSALADSPQVAGCLELLAGIYRESGRYDDARKAGLRYLRLLEATPSHDPVMVAKRQEIAVSLAEIALAREDFPQALEMVERALSLPAGVRQTDPLWESRVYAIKARIEQKRPDADAARRAWSEVESRIRAVLETPDRAPLNYDSQEAAVGLLTQALIGLGKPAEAIAARERLLARQSADDVAAARNLAQIATCYAELADDAGEQRVLEAAIALLDKHEKDNKHAQDNKEQQDKTSAEYADLVDRLALVLEHRGQNDAAQRRWTEAAAIYEGLIKPAATDDRHLERQMQYCQSLQAVYQQLNEWDDAIRVTRRLLEHREQTMLPEDPNLWRAKSALGAFYGKRDDATTAKPLLIEAAAYWRSRVPPAPMELARTLNNLAEVARNNGGYAEALKHLEEAVPICQRIYAKDDVRLAEVYSNLAGVLSAQGRYKAAIDQYRQTIEICRAGAGPVTRRAKELLATTLVNTAMLYKSQRQFREAARYCADALEVQRASTGADESGLVPFYTALASLYLAQDQAHPTGPASVSVDLGQAAQFTAQAHDLCQKYNLGEQPAGILVLQLEAMIHLRKGELEPGATALKQALVLAQRCRQASLSAKSLTYLAEIALRRGTPDRAAELAGEALKIHEQVQAYPNLRFMAYLTEARAQRELGNRDKAAESLGRAIDLVEAPRAATVGAESERAEYFSQFVAAFDLLVDWSVAEGDYAKALSAAEQGRNRTFLDQMRAAGVDLRQSLRDSPQADLLVHEHDVLSRYHEALASLREAYARGAPAAELKETVARIESLKQDYARIETDIRDASPIYRNLLGAKRQAQTWDEIAAPILAPGNALVLYYLGHAESHLFVIDGRSRSIEYFPLDVPEKLADRIGLPPGPLTRAALAHLVASNLKVLRDKNLATQPALSQRPGVSKQRGLSKTTVESKKGQADLSGHALTTDEQLALAQVVLPAAARAHIAKLDAKSVIVVPDGALDQLPLESLLLAAEPVRYLLDEFPAITYAPSATIMAMLVERRPSGAGTQASLLTVGDPAYGEPQALDGYSQEIATSAEYRTLGGLLTPLPGTLAECQAVEKAIASSSPGAHVVLLSGAAATEGNVRARIGNRRFVHLAAHGLIDQRYGNLFGAIAVTPPPTILSSEDDGFLSLYEIHNLSLPACELVVLSSCETNVGADRPLEAGSTLARAFLAAGARDVICSQWSVDDAASAALVSDFFRNLSPQLQAGGSVDFAQALRDARRSVRNQAAWSSPYFWAPFVLVGPGASAEK